MKFHLNTRPNFQVTMKIICTHSEFDVFNSYSFEQNKIKTLSIPVPPPPPPTRLSSV